MDVWDAALYTSQSAIRSASFEAVGDRTFRTEIERDAIINNDVKFRVGATAETAIQSALLRCIFGNPFRPISLAPQWRTSTVLALACGIYDERAFDRLPILADALQDAGCENADILDHCRGPGPHARGCWVVDLVLGKQREWCGSAAKARPRHTLQ